MTEITTTTEDRVECINEILDDMVRYIEEKEDLTKDLADFLHLLMPGDEHRILTLNWNQGGIYIFGVMKISLFDLVKTLLPYLHDDLVPTPDLRHMRISPWL